LDQVAAKSGVAEKELASKRDRN